MGSLRPLVSLDYASTPVWSLHAPKGTRLVRQSSLPTLFLFQAEVAIGALLGKCSSLGNASFLLHEGQSVAPAAKIPLACIHRSSDHWYIDDIPEFGKSLKRSAQDHLSRPYGKLHRQSSAPLPNCKKEAISASEDLDVEKSVVYSELRECSYNWQVPPSFFRPYEGGEKFFTPSSMLHDPLGEPDQQHNVQILSDLCMQSGIRRNHVKDPPMSLRMLKRKLSKISTHAHSDLQFKPSHKTSAPELASHCGAVKSQFNAMDVVDPVSTAFASLVYMLKVVQQYALFISCMQPDAEAANESSHQNWVRRAYAEMLDSFLWLFQQVFSCTPKLMLLTMILLADFTSHSMSKHVALPVMQNGEPPSSASVVYNTGRPAISALEAAPLSTGRHLFKEGIRPSEHETEDQGEIGGVVEVNQHGQIEGNGCSSAQSSIVTNVTKDDVGARISTSPELLPITEYPSLQAYLGEVEGIKLDKTTKNMLVAPVLAPVLEADDYPCFDRTDLAYQHEISIDPTNPLLLSNYAQFLHVVRHDNARAEKFYQRAALADKDEDGEVMGRFASFLWVVKGDTVEADRAYRAAIAADPFNAYHAGSYAHFLWNSNAGQAEEMTFCSKSFLGTAS